MEVQQDTRLAAGRDVDTEEIQYWAEGLDRVHGRIAGRFARSEPRARARAYLEALLSPVERKNGWQIAEHVGEETPYGIQRLVASASWDAEAVRDDLRDYVVEHLGSEEAVLVLDETGFLKKGEKSVGVARQYTGTAGKIENCQIGVFLGYAAPEGFGFLDRALYLPKAWTGARERLEAAGVPEDVRFRTKPELARLMLERALGAGVPAKWVTADEVYGRDRRLRVWLEGRAQPFVLAVAANTYLWMDTGSFPEQQKASAVARRLSEAAWRRLSCGEGSKGPRLYDWAFVSEARLRQTDGFRRGLLVRRSIADPSELAYYAVLAPEGATLEEIVRVAGQRWAVERGFEDAKQEAGLDDYEVRSWTGWHRHVTLSLLAHAYLAVTRARAAAPARAADDAPETSGARASEGAEKGEPSTAVAPTCCR